MRYFIISLLTLLLTFSGCGKKSTSVSSSPYASHSDSTSRISEAGAIGDVIAPAPILRMYPVSSVESSIPTPVEPMPLPTVRPTPPKREVQSGILTAADIDDNLNLSYFQKYINKVLQSTAEGIFPFMSSKNRFTLMVKDTNGNAVNRAKVTIDNFTGYTNTAGILHIFPQVDGIDESKEEMTINGQKVKVSLTSNSSKEVTLNLNATAAKTLDLMFVVDTTGSMGDEMRYLAKEFDAIVSTVEEKHPNVDIRFGLTLYRDKGDDYVVRNFDFTSNKNKMKNQLEKQSANGGGDYPEAMDKGIEKALNASWKAEDGVRMMFIVADAPPHDEKIKQMVPIIEKARAMGIHIYPLGASGVAEKAEYLMRHLALFTSGRYLWLTDDSGVGNSHEEPKVKCYQVTRLDQLISRVIQSELSGKRVEANDDSIVRTVGSYQNGICQ